METKCKKCNTVIPKAAGGRRSLRYVQCRQVFAVDMGDAKCPNCGEAVKAAKVQVRLLTEVALAQSQITDPYTTSDFKKLASDKRGIIGALLLTGAIAYAASKLLFPETMQSSAQAAPILQAMKIHEIADLVTSPTQAVSYKSTTQQRHTDVPEVRGLQDKGPDAWMDYISSQLDLSEVKANMLPSGAGARVSSGFGYRVDPYIKKWRFHHGLDLAMKYGTPVKALLPGKVLYAGYAQDYGRVIFVEHPHGLVTVYGHLAKIIAEEGDEIAKNKIIGLVGMTGRATGPHLHFEVRLRNKKLDPTMIPQFNFLAKSKAPKRKKKIASANRSPVS